MSTIIERFEKIKSKITSLESSKPINIIAVSKTFSLDYIKPLINHVSNKKTIKEEWPSSHHSV